MSRGLLTLREAADELGCSPSTLKRRVRSGALPVFRDGRLLRVRRVDLARYVMERMGMTAGPARVTATGRVLPPTERLWDR